MWGKRIMVSRVRLNGTAGADFLVGQLNAENVIYASAGDDYIRGGSLADTLVGEAGRDTIDGGLGNDGLWGGGGDDRLNGGDGADYLSGDGGNDILDGGTGADRLLGGLGNDTYYVDNAGDVITEISGQGIDTVYASSSYTMAANIENLIITTGSNVISGNELANTITGSGLADTVKGGGGSDTISGGTGADVLDGGDGQDRLLGGDGNDVLSGNDGNDSLDGAYGKDVMSGGQGNDYVNAGADADTIYGGAGNDGVYGGGGNDTIFGEDGNDRLYGDGGDDYIRGGAGSDVMTGGQINGAGNKGANTYAWARADIVNGDGNSTGLDHITDFGTGDRIDFSLVFSRAQATHIADYIKVADTSAGTVISADVGGGHLVDVVVLDNVHHVTFDDLVSHHMFLV